MKDGWGGGVGSKRHQSLSLLSNSSSSQVFNVNNGLPEGDNRNTEVKVVRIIARRKMLILEEVPKNS